MKNKLLIFVAMTILIMTLFAVFTITASAEENSIVVRYCHMSGSEREKIAPNADGTYTLREQKFSGDGNVTLANGTSVPKTFYGWFDKEGNIYEPGATMAFSKDTDLFEAYGVNIANADDLEAVTKIEKNAICMRLVADIETTNDLNSSWGTMILDLNGHNLTITSQNHAINNYRGSTMIIGQGKITHAPETINEKDDQTGFADFQAHGYGDWDTMQHFIVGKNVTIETPYNLVRITNGNNYAETPNMFIAGTVKAKTLIRAGILTNATIKIFPTANLTFTGNDVFVITNETSTSIYSKITIDGTIKIENSEAVLFDDFIMSNRFEIAPISGGTYSFFEKDAERLELLLPDTLMIYTQEDESGVKWYKIKESDCVHVWTRVDNESTEATVTESGIDILLCDSCGAKKQKIALYTPKKTSVLITVVEDGQRKQYTVLGGDVFEFGFVGTGVNAKCAIVGLKDTASFSKEQIVGIEIPEGIMLVEAFENETIKEIKIADSSLKIEVGNLSSFKALKDIKIGTCEITFLEAKSATLEGIYSETAGAIVTFGNNAFANMATLKTLKLSTGSTYKFNANCFKESGLTAAIFPDDSTIQFVADAAFYGCPDLKYVYFGKNCISDKRLTKKPFDCAFAIETIILMDIEYIDQYVFCCNGDANSDAAYREGKSGYMEPVKVYHHGDKIEVNGNAFLNRTVNGVEFYTLSAITSLSNCKYTIVQGLGHKYFEGAITESTCLVQGTYGYTTDCPCGIEYRENNFTVIDDAGSSTYMAYGTDFIYLPLSDIHVLGTELVDITYENYFENGSKNYLCAICANANVLEEVPSVSPLFMDLGYSVNEDGEAGEMSYSVKVDQNVLSLLREFKSVSYGVVAGSYLNGKPITETGKTTTGNINVEMKGAHYQVSIKIGNILGSMKDYEFNLAAYVVENDDNSNVRYAYENQTLSNTEKISYNQLKAELEKEPEPPIEEPLPEEPLPEEEQIQ